MDDISALLIGSGAGVAVHDVITHGGFPMDRPHGWHLGLALLGIGLGTEALKEE